MKFKELVKSGRLQVKQADGWTVVKGCHADLSSVTALPDNIKFENHGYVYLSGVTSPQQYMKTWMAMAIVVACALPTRSS